MFIPFQAGLKCAASPSVLQSSLLKRAKLIETAPSLIAQPSRYRSLQGNPSQKVFDDRPSDPDIAPIALLYHGFGHFQDIISHREAVNTKRWRSGVDRFAEAMSCYYSREDERRDAALSELNSIFSAHVGAIIPSFHAASIGPVRSDGHSVGRHSQPLHVIEVKNELTGIQSLPHIEAVAYIGRLHNSMASEAKCLLEQRRMPCLGMTIVGV